MSVALPASLGWSAASPKADGEIVEACLLDGRDHEALRDLFVDWWLKDRFRVRLDCSHIVDLTIPALLTVVRFSNEFSCRGGFVRLTKVNARLRSTLRGLNCTCLSARQHRCGKAGRLTD